MKKTKLIIIGGGLAGLSAAFYAQKQNLDFLLLEAQSCLGGVISTKKINSNYIIEQGPNSLALGATLKEIVSDLKFSLLPAQAIAKKKLIYINNKLIPVNSLDGLFRVLSLKTFFKITQEIFLKDQIETQRSISIGEFFENHFGAEVVNNLLWPILSGIYAGNPYKLEMSSVFPELYKISQKHSSLLIGLIKEKPQTKFKREIFSTESGLEGLIEKMQKFIPSQKIILNTPINSLKDQKTSFIVNDSFETEKLIIATPAYIAAELYPEFLANLAQIYYAPIITLNFWLKVLEEYKNAFGFLSARSQNTPLLGTVFNSALFPIHAPKMAITCFVGGANYSELIDYEIEKIQQIAIEELLKALPQTIQSDFELKNFKYWPKAIPQYNLGHKALIKNIQSKMPPNLKLAGNYLQGISLEDSALSGKKALDDLFDN